MGVLRNLSESELSTQAITPLLRAMFSGARIEFTHGPDEKGRDYICYARHPVLNQRVTYCVQVKNHKINSQIGSPYSISTLRQQVQAAKETGVLGSDNEKLRPDEVWIINTYDCTDNFRRKNVSDFDAIKSLSGRFVDGDELETLLNRLCPHVVAELLQWKDARSVEMISKLSIHRESRAFGLRFDRMISDFYIQARTSVGSTLIGLFEADKLKIEDLSIVRIDTIEAADIGSLKEEKGSGFSADDIAQSHLISIWSDLAKIWPLQIRWSSKIAADPKHRGRSILEKVFEVGTAKAQVALRRRLAQARRKFPSTLDGNEAKVTSALETFLMAEQLLRACEAERALTRLSKDLMGTEPPALQVDSDLSVLKLGRIVLIEGGPGGGKTTLLRRIAIAILRTGGRLKYLECAKVEPAQIIAAVADVQRRLKGSQELVHRAPIWDSVFDEIDRRASSTDDRTLRDGGFVGIVDGLDELPAGLLAPFVEAFLSGSNCFDRLIVSCRDSYASDLKGRVPVLTVSRFEDPEREEFFRRWFSPSYSGHGWESAAGVA